MMENARENVFCTGKCVCAGIHIRITLARKGLFRKTLETVTFLCVPMDV